MRDLALQMLIASFHLRRPRQTKHWLSVGVFPGILHRKHCSAHKDAKNAQLPKGGDPDTEHKTKDAQVYRQVGKSETPNFLGLVKLDLGLDCGLNGHYCRLSNFVLTGPRCLSHLGDGFGSFIQDLHRARR